MLTLWVYSFRPGRRATLQAQLMRISGTKRMSACNSKNTFSRLWSDRKRHKKLQPISSCQCPWTHFPSWVFQSRFNFFLFIWLFPIDYSIVILLFCDPKYFVRLNGRRKNNFKGKTKKKLMNIKARISSSSKLLSQHENFEQQQTCVCNYIFNLLNYLSKRYVFAVYVSHESFVLLVSKRITKFYWQCMEFINFVAFILYGILMDGSLTRNDCED